MASVTAVHAVVCELLRGALDDLDVVGEGFIEDLAHDIETGIAAIAELPPHGRCAKCGAPVTRQNKYKPPLEASDAMVEAASSVLREWFGMFPGEDTAVRRALNKSLAILACELE